MKLSFKSIFIISHQKLCGDDIYNITSSQCVLVFFFFNLKLKPSSRAFSQGPVLSGDEICNSQPKLVIFQLLYEKFFQNISEDYRKRKKQILILWLRNNECSTDYFCVLLKVSF